MVGTAVGGRRVGVGLGVLVEGGRGVFVNVARGSLVRAVTVMNTRGVAVAVGVRVGVRVGVSVGLGISEAVAVGAVEVGKGPSRACEVSARAVRVRIAFRCRSVESRDSREASADTARIKPINKSIANTIIASRFSLKFLKFTLAALLIGTLPA